MVRISLIWMWCFYRETTRRLTEGQRALILQLYRGEGVMPPAELKSLIVTKLQDAQPHSVPELVRELTSDPNIYESDVRSALLGLVRRNEIDLTDDFRIRLPHSEHSELPVAV
jgi:hypothetical protein